MALPSLVKTWQNSINQAVAAQGSVNATEKRLLRTIKNLLIGFGTNPWAVRGSSDSATASSSDLSDRWVTDANIVKAAAASPHSWMLLRQTGIATNFELCIDCLNANALTIVVSPSAGFTGGTTSARPTATDEIVILSNASWFSGVDAQHQIHAQMSTDGKCTRVQAWRGTTNQCTFWMFDVPLNAISGWTNPSISYAVQAGSGIGATVAVLQAAAGNLQGRVAATVAITLTGEAAVGGQLSQLTGIGTVVSDIDSAWPLFPVGAYSITTSNKGRLGTIADLWWKPINVADATTFPTSATVKEFAALGTLVFPWTNGTDTPLLV